MTMMNKLLLAMSTVLSAMALVGWIQSGTVMQLTEKDPAILFGVGIIFLTSSGFLTWCVVWSKATGTDPIWLACFIPPALLFAFGAVSHDDHNAENILQMGKTLASTGEPVALLIGELAQLSPLLFALFLMGAVGIWAFLAFCRYIYSGICLAREWWQRK